MSSQSRSIKSTKNYRMFKIVDENRPLNIDRHKKLRYSMQKYGFLKSFPVACIQNGSKHVTVKDGQHRIAIAEELGLPVYYYVDDVDFDVAEVNCTAKVWSIRDYCEKYAANGNKHYQEALEFADQYKLPLSKAMTLLYGCKSVGGCRPSIVQDGLFKVKAASFAHDVAGCYVSMAALSRSLRSNAFLGALIMAFSVDGFDGNRLVRKASKCRERLVPYSTKEAFLDMIEDVYNFKQKTLDPIKVPALQAARQHVKEEK